MAGEQAVILTLPFPPSANRYWRHVGKKVLLSEEARWYREVCRFACLVQWKQAPLEGRVRIHADCFFPDARGDLMNREKQMCDAIQGYIYLNDSQIYDMRMVRHTDKERPRVELTVEALEEKAGVPRNALLDSET